MEASTQMTLPVLALRDVVVFPNVTIPLYVGRTKSLRAIEEAQKASGQILLLAQRTTQAKDPHPEDLYTIGTTAIIKQVAKLPDGNVKLLVEGTGRARVVNYLQTDQFFQVTVELIREPLEADDTQKMLMKNLIGHYESFLKLTGKQLEEGLEYLESIREPHRLISVIAAQFPLRLSDRQDLLEVELTNTRLEKLSSLILSEIETIKLDRKIKNKVREQIEKSQRDYFLNEQLNVIQKELGHENDPKEEVKELEEKLAKKDMPESARERAQKEIKRLKTSSGHPAEASVIRNYVDLILELPWNTISQDKTNIEEAKTILDRDHFGLKDVKERILEFLAVRSRVGNPKAPVICFVGPPGVGKTSLAQSIASSMGRKFERISLGGMRDEAELRGHRRTYIGALPGKIIAAIRKTGTSNPVILLDEIDKVGVDFRGDPASVLLEILDPEQNKNFTDHYLDLEYDLSKVLFIATANLPDPISPPLRDRMEVIPISGYNEKEKLEIAKNYIVPKEKKNHGLDEKSLQLTDEALLYIIQNYTKEAGVRNIQREVAKLCRKVVREFDLKDVDHRLVIEPSNVEKYLGVPKFRKSVREKTDEVGLATGLAWTPTGGDVLYVEASVVPGKGRVQITGQLGNIMQESAKAALSYIRARAKNYGIEEDYFAKRDIHIHVPEGAIPKDGPSAGITMATAVLSALLQVPVRRDVGMTGEITLRGRILPIGGLKEKLLAAQRAGLSTVLYPLENEPEKSEIDADIYEGVETIPVYHMDEVIDKTLDFKAVSLKENSGLVRPPKAKKTGPVQFHH